jgi:hypothetical protein
VKSSDEIRQELSDSWIPDLYREKVRSQRTRAFGLDIAEREHKPEILHTLLGIELKVGNSRFACPDLATARYMRIFARLGVRDFAVPYDITKISIIADTLETAWQRMLLLIESVDIPAASSSRLRSKLVRQLRSEINQIGPGELMPKFDRETRQRAK